MEYSAWCLGHENHRTVYTSLHKQDLLQVCWCLLLCYGSLFECLDYTNCLALFPGPTQLSIAISTASDEKLGGAWEQGY